MTLQPEYTILKTISHNHKTSFVKVIRNIDQKLLILKIPENSNDLAVKNEFIHELDIQNNLKTESVLKCLAMDFFQNQQVLVFEDTDAVFLNEFIAEKDFLPIEVFLNWAVEITEALTEIHQLKIIHKNIRPENILINLKSGKVQFTGFGQASLLIHEIPDPGNIRLTEGALPYISPEQTGLLKLAIDNRSDLYSLGVTFFQMLTKKFPFEAHDPLEWIHCHIARHQTRPEFYNPNVPQMISEIISKLMSKGSDDRYQSAAGVYYDLNQCLESWRNLRKIPLFETGRKDISSKLIIPSRLYGRDREKIQLINSYLDFKSVGKNQLCFISGYSGIGKSSLVREIYTPVIHSGGQVITGKFDQIKTNIPFATIIQAFQELISTILIDTEESINDWKTKLSIALGNQGQLIIDVIPQVRLLIGTQPPVQEFPPQEAHNRFRKVFNNFISVFASPDHPLVLFLDDLQWADSSSIEFIRDLLFNNESSNLFLIGAYRDNEVKETHPVFLLKKEMQSKGIRVCEIKLEELAIGNIADLIIDIFHCDSLDAVKLAGLVFDKTAGNPYFIIQFLTSLYEDDLIKYNKEEEKWCWDIAQIAQQGITENVIDLIIKKIKRLSGNTQHYLQQLSCIGESADIDLLTIVFDQNEAELKENFKEALNNNMIVYSGEKYKFPHDRVQEAAYSLLSSSDQQLMHLKIGRLLNGKMKLEERQFKIFDIADQFNKAINLLTPEELNYVMELNRIASIKARKSTAFRTAVLYAEFGLKCFQRLNLPDSSVDEYGIIFELHYLKIQNEVALGNFKSAQINLTPLLQKVETRKHKVLLQQLQVEIYTAESKSENALQVALEGMALYDLKIPLHPESSEVEKRVGQVEHEMQQIGFEKITKLPMTKDEEFEVIMGMMALVLPNAYFTDNNLHRMVSAQMISLTLKNGVCAHSAMAFAAFGFDCCGLSRYREAKKYGEMGYAIMTNNNFESVKSKVCNLIGACTSPWNDSYSVAIEFLRQGTRAESGDAIFASLCQLYVLLHSFSAGENLDKVFALSEETVVFVKAQGFTPINVGPIFVQRLILLLKGKTDSYSSFSGKNFDEEKYLITIKETSLPLMMTWYHNFKLQAAVLFNDTEKAINELEHTESLLFLLKGQQVEADFAFFGALAITAAWNNEIPEEWEKRLYKFSQSFQLWTEINPANYSGRHFLIQAEIARLNKNYWEATALFQQSIKASRSYGFLHVEALACERAADFFLQQGFESLADNYFREAYSAYKSWGAKAKLEQLEKVYPKLMSKKLSVSSVESVQPIDFDFYSAVKASLAISEVIELDKLITELLHIALEQSGAEKATLLLCRDNSLFIEAQAHVVENDIVSEIKDSAAFEDVDFLPLSIVRFVLRAKEKVIYNESADNHKIFSSDIYIKKHKPKSVLCLPILRSNELEGVLYLENSLLSGVFSAERMMVLELIASQSAISLQNAQLFKSLKEEIVQRKNVEAALRASKEQLQSIIDSTPSLVYIKQPDGKFILVNKKFEELLGKDRLQIIDKTDFDFFPYEEAERFRKNDLIVFQKKIAIEKEEVTTIENELRYYLSIKFPLFSDNGDITSVCGISTDITDRKRIEIEKEEIILQKQMALIEAEKSIAARDNFIAIASHELRTPITPLRIYIDILKEKLKDLPLDSSSHLNTVVQAIQRSDQSLSRLTRLTEDLLNVSRIQSGQYMLEKSKFDILQLAQSIAERFLNERKMESSKIKVMSEHEKIIGFWDYSKIEQVFENLVSNALKYGLGQNIEIHFEKTTSIVRFTVRDYGIGIKSEEHDSIFERFGRASSIRNFEGLGLGLYIVKEIIQAHEGSIRVESQLNQGSSFIVELPLRS